MLTILKLMFNISIEASKKLRCGMTDVQEGGNHDVAVDGAFGRCSQIPAESKEKV